jgi:hypothetical protein
MVDLELLADRTARAQLTSGDMVERVGCGRPSAGLLLSVTGCVETWLGPSPPLVEDWHDPVSRVRNSAAFDADPGGWKCSASAAIS